MKKRKSRREMASVEQRKSSAAAWAGQISRFLKPRRTALWQTRLPKRGKRRYACNTTAVRKADVNSNIFYIIGVVVVIAIVLKLLGLY